MRRRLTISAPIRWIARCLRGGWQVCLLRTHNTALLSAVMVALIQLAQGPACAAAIGSGDCMDSLVRILEVRAMVGWLVGTTLRLFWLPVCLLLLLLLFVLFMSR